MTITTNKELINAYARMIVEKEQQLTQEKRKEADEMEVAAAKEQQVTQEKRKEAVEMDAAVKFEATGETSGFSFLLFLSCSCQNASFIYYLI